jgi:outer membrane putative beta-barrel porin/alpha-amylase
MKHRFTNACFSVTLCFVYVPIHRWLIYCIVCFAAVAVSSAQEPLAKGIQDNSFFVEEAYNQEAGVVQHIFNLPIFSTHGDKEISPTFTQEWPFFGQTHQLSYTIPYTFAEDVNGLEDIRLNYRLQALMESERTPAFAPRLSFVLPTGDANKGFGHDRPGYEINLPFSKIVSDRWTLHLNAGGSIFPDVRDRDLWNCNLGASAIFAVSRDFNLMLESVVNWEEDVDDSRHVDRTVAALISPGARYAFNLPNDLQIVLGAAVPIGLTSDSPDWGLFFYLSFEHPFVRAKKTK